MLPIAEITVKIPQKVMKSINKKSNRKNPHRDWLYFSAAFSSSSMTDDGISNS